jgi:hypothetical protein
MKKEMKRYKVTHIVLCEVATYRTILAENFDEAMKKVAAIETLTSTGDGGDYEIMSDLETKQMRITEVV